MTAIIAKRVTVIAAAVIAVGFAGCATMNVSSHVARGVDFSRFQTWDWGPADALPTGDPRLDANPFFKDRFEGAVEKGLALRGLARANAGGPPDLLIHYHANVSRRFQVSEPRTDCQGDCQVSVIEFDQGTLVLDVVDTGTDRPVWRGWAQDNVERTIDNQDRLGRQIDEAVAKILAQFPRSR